MAARENTREADKLAASSPQVKPIPIFGSAAAEELKAITNKFELPSNPSLGQALTTIYFSHRDLWLRQREGSKALKRYAKKINTATRKYLCALRRNSTFVRILCAPLVSPNCATIEDINTLRHLLQRIEFNSHTAMRAKAPRGRAKDQLAVTVAAELGQLYDSYCPPSSHRLPRGVSRSTIRVEFVHDVLKLLNLDLTEASIRTYREKKHALRVRS